MSNSAYALIGLASWAIIQTFILLTVRLVAMRDGRAMNSFDPQGKDLAGFGQRATRAHINTLENLAILASFLLFGIATDQTAITEGLACWVLYARIAQSVTHMISISVPMVLLRATLFTVQLVICVIWAWDFWHA
ncbi:MAG: MAPEG family protein [Gammaproteobacteria bacterium]